MKIIYKYELEEKTIQKIEVPEGAKFISAINQADNIVVYAIVDDKETKKVTKEIIVLGTGKVFKDMTIEEKHQFLGSISTMGGVFVWHVFVEK